MLAENDLSVVSPAGSTSDVKALAPKNALAPIVCSFDPAANVIDVSAAHPLKLLSTVYCRLQS